MRKSKPSDHTLLREVTKEILFCEPSLKLNLKWRNYPSNQNRKKKWISAFVAQYQPSASNLKQILMKNWYLIESNNDHYWPKSTRIRPLFRTKEGFRSKIYLCSWEPRYEKRLKHTLESHAGLSTPLHWLYNSGISINFIDTTP